MKNKIKILSIILMICLSSCSVATHQPKPNTKKREETRYAIWYVTSQTMEAMRFFGGIKQ